MLQQVRAMVAKRDEHRKAAEYWERHGYSNRAEWCRIEATEIDAELEKIKARA